MRKASIVSAGRDPRNAPLRYHAAMERGGKAPGRSRRWLFRAVAALLPALLLLILWEAWLRATRTSTGERIEVVSPAGYAGPLTVPDPDIGWTFKPGLVYRSTSLRGEWKDVEIRINRLGFRGADPRSDFPDEGLRIVVLGDSFTHARQVPEERTYWRLLEEELARELAPRPVEVVNLSADGFSTTQEIAAFRKLGAPLKPDLVILNLYVGNDLKENSMAFWRKKHGAAAVPRRPFWEPDGAGGWKALPFEEGGQAMERRRALGEEEAEPEETASRSVWRQAFGSLFPATRRWLRSEVRFSPLGGFLIRAGLLHRHSLAELPSEVRLYLDPIPPEWDEPFETTRLLLRTLKKDVETSGAQLLVNIIPESFAVHTERWGGIETGSGIVTGFPILRDVRTGLGGPEERLKRMMGVLQPDETDPIAWSQTAAPFLATLRYRETCLYFPADRHFTSDGHAILAESLKSEILQMEKNR